MLNQNYDYEPPAEEQVATWETPTYAGDGRVVVAPHTHALTTTPVTGVQTRAPTSEMVMLGSLLQSVQNTQQQQNYMLREMAARLARLEDNARVVVAPAASFERSSWWAIWGLLMLVMGAALAVILILLLSQITFR